jgi:alpha-1,2-mannosyltransferase
VSAQVDRSPPWPTAVDLSRAPRTLSRPRLRTRTQVWLVFATIVAAGAAAYVFGRRYTFFDVKIYHGAVEWWLAGGDLYEFIAPGTTLGFTYPPFAALVMLPMATMSAISAGWVSAVVSVVALGLVLAAILLPITDRLGWPRGLALGMALPLALALEPGRETLGFGQVNLLLFGLVMADLVGLRARSRAGQAAAATAQRTGPDHLGEALRRFWRSGVWAGAGIGLATAVKITPGLFIVYLLLSRQWRPAAVAAGTATAASLVAFLYAPRESLAYFTSVLWQTDRVGAADFTPNQSLAGVLARLYDQTHAPTMLWVSFAAVCAALGLSRAVTAHREGDELAAFTLVGLTAVILSPISWTHHFVFVIPAIVVMADAALRHRQASRGLGFALAAPAVRYAAGAVGTYVLFLVSPIWWVHHRLPEGSHYDSGLWGVLAENSLALGLIVLVAAMPWRPGAEPAFGQSRSRLAGVRGW